MKCKSSYPDSIQLEEGDFPLAYPSMLRRDGGKTSLYELQPLAGGWPASREDMFHYMQMGKDDIAIPQITITGIVLRYPSATDLLN